MDKLVLKQGNIEEYTVVLCTRDYRKIGQLYGIKTETISVANRFNSANEISFSLVKYDLLKPEAKELLSNEEYEKYICLRDLLWVQIIDHKLIWVKELDEYYEIKVTINDTQETVKNIHGMSLCEAELSQYKVTLEINSEADILRDDYEVTTFCNFANPSASLLHRAIKDKAPHYKIGHVDESLQKIQRTFSVNEVDIYGFFTGEVSEQFNCLFQFDSSTRTISAYDLYTTCSSCGHRGEFYDECPECGNVDKTKMKYFGNDTTIFVDTKNLTDQIQVETNADSIKNCLKMVAGDELMTATIRLLNQNGSDYLYYISENQMNDMPKELTDLLGKYQIDYDSYIEEYQKQLSILYQATDDILYLESGMMPTIEQAEVTAKTEADKLTEENLSPVALSYVTKGTSVTTASAAIKNYAKVYAKSGYVKIDIADGATFEYVGEDTVNKWNYGIWTGKIVITNYSDEEDIATTDTLTIIVHDNYEAFVSQKVLKQLAQSDDESSVFDVLAIEDLDDFTKSLTYYSRDRLQSFHDAIQSALDILIQLNQADENADLYNVLYSPYYEKLQACQLEIDKRQAEIDLKQKELDEADFIISDIQSKLNFQNYLGDEYYKIYCAYRREDTYSNANYISDGLSNVELIDRAKEFIETAKKELVKAAEPQYTISSTLKNFLVLPEFKPIIHYFELGNWIRIKADNDVYRLRLIGYDIDFGNLDSLSVEFSTMSKVKDVVNEAQQIINSAKAISTSFTYVSKQAEKGKEAKSNVDDWINNGLNNALVNIKSNDDVNVFYNEHGILCRYKDEETGEYSPKQLKILYNNIALTKDAWKTCSQAIGEHSYTVYNPETNQTEVYVGYGVTAEFLSAPHIAGKTIIGGKIYSTNYSDGSNKELAGTAMDLDKGTFSFAGGKLRYDGTDLIVSEESIGNAVANIDITAANLRIPAANIDGQIENEKIKSIDGGKITGSISASQVSGKVSSASQADSATNANYATSAGSATTATTAQSANSVPASGITGTVSSDKIDGTLSEKVVTGSFEGDITATSLNTTHNRETYSGLTTDIELENITLHFVNGLLVNTTTN